MPALALDELSAEYDHVYLSPHLDDAPLSCGGRIATQIAAGQRVLAITLCTAAPAPEGPFSDLALDFHRHWALPPERVVSARLEEERNAMALLRCDHVGAGMLDAIYRNPAAYTSRDSLFALPDPHDPLYATLHSFIGDLRARFPNAQFYAPLGVGSHVDHLITFTACRDVIGSSALFYEDLPYAVKPGALDERLAQVGRAMEPHTLGIDTTLEQKITSIKAYPSQMEELFGSEDGMVDAMVGYARSLATAESSAGERVWSLPNL